MQDDSRLTESWDPAAGASHGNPVDEKIAGLMSYGIDEITFLACSRCGKVVCPKCCGICEICDALVSALFS